MKKSKRIVVLSAMLALVFALALPGAAFAAEGKGGEKRGNPTVRFIDANGDGICDNYDGTQPGQGLGQGGGGQGCGGQGLGFVDADGDGICDNKEQSARLASSGQTQIDALPYVGMCRQVSSETFQQAHGSDMGVARFEAAQILMELDASIGLEDCQSMSLNELRRRIAEFDPNNAYVWQGGGQGYGQGSGQGNGQGSRSG